ncbi:DUF3108 domain-containing protein [Colwellia piezophila]|uniref:DUF3108 domain-containing protein n=1 Tax=Colwellia piezophila TaxID=211668 RepID=UPI000399C406|nr:DUF3108 domain-containing protein [Colwellia piezophila]
MNNLTASELKNLHQCQKTFEYDVHFFGGKVGYLHRTIKWDKISTVPQAAITSKAEVSFFWLDSTYNQKTTLQYSKQHKHFLTPGFSQKLSGLKNRTMTAKMSNNGLSSTVTLDDEVTHYPQKDENKDYPLYGIDTLGAQIRLNLLQDKKKFMLSRQASNRVDTYQFEVAGVEVIDHKKWGKLATIKVIEVGEHDSIVLWFSKNHDFQLVKAELDMIFSPVVWLTDFSMQCEP